MGQKNSHHDSAKKSSDCGPGLGFCDAPESRQRMVNNMGEDHPLLRLLCQHAALNDAEGIRRECGAADGIARSLINTPTRVTVSTSCTSLSLSLSLSSIPPQCLSLHSAHTQHSRHFVLLVLQWTIWMCRSHIIHTLAAQHFET
jgi:hypothetical protein